MCGVIGLIFERHRPDLGVISGELLRTLEYRGYDSTGAAIQADGDEVDLRKDVGAPSVMVGKLGIDRLGGRILCAQVRWATFGAVDQTNAQPHVVRCKTYLYGAHNGNVTNCDALKEWLTEEGHHVQSDNDGEMVVHTTEHFFGVELSKLSPLQRQDPEARRGAMRRALIEAGARLKGSYAAVVVDPIARRLWAIKKGSSLYFGVGEVGGTPLAIASSDLSSVLKLTRALVPLAEGEVVEYDAEQFQVLRLKDAARLERRAVRSRLRARDTALEPPFTTFMEQEIHAQIETTRSVVSLFAGASPAADRLAAELDACSASDRSAILAGFDRLRDLVSDQELKRELDRLGALPAVSALLGRMPDVRSHASTLAAADAARILGSSERGLLADLWALSTLDTARGAILLLDAHLQHEERIEHARAIDRFCERVIEAPARGGRVFVVSCGSSYHAAKTASLFFNDIAGVQIVPLLPGELRGQVGLNLRDGDALVSVSQSGETKDLIDVINDVIASGRDVLKIALVNNLNSTLAQEKSDVVIPLRCGPEIAVAATKSFINQLTVLYCLAIEVGLRIGAPEAQARREALKDLPGLIERTLADTDASLDQAAELLYLRPSLHLLATRILGVAREGALKIREVVLTHGEGFEASEFKHGPNTILGRNTIYGIDQLARLLAVAGREARTAIGEWSALGLDPAVIGERLERALASALDPALGDGIPSIEGAQAALAADYPLLYVTGPGSRDIDLTVSQINTHKIRGASTVIVAEEDAQLRGAASKRPADNSGYRWVYVALPRTGDPLLTAFSATVALQRLALKMSLKKKAYLDALGLREHGVHPDVPKNVSKSITVD
ncbi:MAG: SIS domain-containing protein [Deltaproteobacteria bacterium]|nr:SIS domain-containing protein [Deltaproteobacteria bacterium]